MHDGSNKMTLNILYQDDFDKNCLWKDVLKMVLPELSLKTFNYLQKYHHVFKVVSFVELSYEQCCRRVFV